MDTNASGYFFPYEVMTIILGHVLPHKSIMQCRLVCKMWRNIIENESWRFVVKLEESKREPYTKEEISKISKMPWFILHAACAEDSLFGRNFVMTKRPRDTPIWNLGDLDSGCWKTVPTDDPNINREDFLILEFSSEYYEEKPTLIIQLPKSGLSCLIMKILPPKITISSWFWLEFVDADDECSLNVELQNLAGTETAMKRDEFNFLNQDLRERVWKKAQVTFKNLKSKFKMDLNTVHVAHNLSITEGDGIVTRILIRIEKPNFFAVDWNSVFKRDLSLKNESLASLLISEHQLFLRTGIHLRGTSISSLLPLYYHSDIGLLAFPGSGILIPEFWYGRPLPDIVVENQVADSWIRYEEVEYLLLYELRCRIHLKRQGLYGFFMDDVQPPIEAYIAQNDYEFHSNAMKYEMMVNLQDNNGKILHQKKASEMLCKGDSKKLLLKFENYGKGVAYVEFSVQRHMSMSHDGDRFITFQEDVKSVIGLSRVQVLLP